MDGPMLYEAHALELIMARPEEIRRESAVQIVSPGDFDGFGNSIPQSVYDPKLGATRDTPCSTCHLRDAACPGHYGHIDLPLPLYNPMTIDIFVKLLKHTCFSCKRMKIGKIKEKGICVQFLLAKSGETAKIKEAEKHTEEENEREIDNLEQEVLTENKNKKENAEERKKILKRFFAMKYPKHCMWCGAAGKPIQLVNSRILVETSLYTKQEEEQKINEEIMLPVEAVGLLQEITEREEKLLSFLFPNMYRNVVGKNFLIPFFFLEILTVTPLPFRPMEQTETGYMSHALRTIQYQNIIRKTQEILHLSSGKEGLTKAYLQLQDELSKIYVSGTDKRARGVKEIIEKKEGLFRRHIMGKRVNFTARSVISPDPCISTDEVGIPEAFAKKLTIPVTVSPLNGKEMIQAIENGPKYPGAKFIEDERGRLISLERMSQEKRKHIANQLLTKSSSTSHIYTAGKSSEETYKDTVVLEEDREVSIKPKRVWRHMKSGDYVMVNRQPSLHKVSMMGHKVRVLKDRRTIRLHYVNCNSYNADFDGDEMNVHFPQNIQAQVEASEICSTDNCYISATNGEPVRGHVQDHVTMAAYITGKNIFLEEEEMMQLLASAQLKGRIILPAPCFVRPMKLYTGKQAISALLCNLHLKITLNSKSKRGDPVYIQEGELLTGTVDKAQIGTASYGMIHAVNEVYGGKAANSLLTAIGKLLNRALQSFGHSCTMDDLIVEQVGEVARTRTIAKGEQDGKSRTESLLNTYPEYLLENTNAVMQGRDPEMKREIDSDLREVSGNISSKALEDVIGSLKRKEEQNRMYLMVSTGAKGSLVNFGQIVSMLGQQELEGMRAPQTCAGRTLPTFSPLEPSLRANGFISQRFLTGVYPEEFFFHCMAGREGLVDTAVKTSRSGYLQRCLIKHMEGLSIAADGSVRDSDGSVIQMVYGEDGIHPEKSAYLHKHEFLKENEEAPPLPFTSPLYASDLYNIRTKRGCISQKHLDTLPEHNDDEKQKIWTRYIKRVADPGEEVGILAAQGVGEPSTQMTLNTFHLAGVGGKNVTLGMPRLNELVMTATKVIKKPIITAYAIDTSTEEQRKKLCAAGRKKLISIIKSLKVQESEALLPEPIRVIKVELETDQEYVHLLSDTLKEKFFLLFQKDMKSFIKSLSQQNIQEVQASSYASAPPSDEDAEDKPMDEESENTHTEEEKENSSDEAHNEENDNKIDKEEEAQHPQQNSSPSGNASSQWMPTNESIGSNLCTIHGNVVTLTLHVSLNYKTIYLSKIEKILKKLHLNSYTDYETCTLSNNQFIIQNGTFNTLLGSISGLPISDVLDIYSARSNSIWEVSRTLGIEAARAAIIREIEGVFSVYGININYRHLSLIADFMTQSGTILPFNRGTFQHRGSPIQKISYESAYSFVKSAVVDGSIDYIQNPSSCICIGKTPIIGTNISTIGFFSE
ncbi:DNA-directed RNA polymerase I subunit RPA1 [Nematocida sp. LUAm3]|nr:DNA-directed RNA polymerase I subunit RPA1 [Nematocida sp. LUAm3]KAI5173924.1 DNA-directed RNA polymerase I subunit RPA1 [Nematocida sp. LUAm2]KAI5177331.1 DNA-directed RNA polymerase I subunit RPA1 [Nematocida sp. LUAm1]